MSVQDDIKASLDKLFSTVVTDDLAVVRPVADNYLNAVVSNPAPANLVAQSLAYEGQFIATLPNLEAASAKDAAASIKALLDLEADKLTGQLAGSIANTAAIGAAATTQTA